VGGPRPWREQWVTHFTLSPRTKKGGSEGKKKSQRTWSHYQSPRCRGNNRKGRKVVMESFQPGPKNPKRGGPKGQLEMWGGKVLGGTFLITRTPVGKRRNCDREKWKSTARHENSILREASEKKVRKQRRSERRGN